MKYFVHFIFLFVLAACSGDAVQDDEIERTPDQPRLQFADFDERISYCIGLDHAAAAYSVYGAPDTKMNFDLQQIEAGMVDYLMGNELRIPFEARDSIFEFYLLPDGTVNETAIAKVDASYAIGMEEGYVLVSSLVGRGIDQLVYVDLLVEGVKDGMTNTKPSVPLVEARTEVTKYYSDLNKENGEAFLAGNATRDSVVVTESGLQYIVFKQGRGNPPNLTDTCVVHYTGRLLDGREFESTVPSQRPVQLTLMGVIPGWQEGLQLMGEGAQYRFFIPYQLAYGAAGSGFIEPYSTLVYDIELIKIKRFN